MWVHSRQHTYIFITVVILIIYGYSDQWALALCCPLVLWHTDFHCLPILPMYIGGDTSGQCRWYTSVYAPSHC